MFENQIPAYHLILLRLVPSKRVQLEERRYDGVKLRFPSHHLLISFARQYNECEIVPQGITGVDLGSLLTTLLIRDKNAAAFFQKVRPAVFFIIN
jgi:hypothetical protein